MRRGGSNHIKRVPIQQNDPLTRTGILRHFPKEREHFLEKEDMRGIAYRVTQEP